MDVETRFINPDITPQHGDELLRYIYKADYVGKQHARFAIERIGLLGLSRQLDAMDLLYKFETLRTGFQKLYFRRLQVHS